MLRINTTALVARVRKVSRRLDRMASELGTTWTATVSLPQDSERHLTWFNDGTTKQPARPVFALNAAARIEVLSAVRARFVERMLRDEEPQMLPVMTVAANAFRAVWVRRLRTSGGDLMWAALSPRYAAWKARKKLDPRIGIARGRMVEAVQRGQIIVRKLK